MRKLIALVLQVTDEVCGTPHPVERARDVAMTMTTRKRRVQSNGDLIIETRVPKWTAKLAKGS